MPERVREIERERERERATDTLPSSAHASQSAISGVSFCEKSRCLFFSYWRWLARWGMMCPCDFWIGLTFGGHYCCCRDCRDLDMSCFCNFRATIQLPHHMKHKLVMFVLRIKLKLLGKSWFFIHLLFDGEATKHIWNACFAVIYNDTVVSKALQQLPTFPRSTWAFYILFIIYSYLKILKTYIQWKCMRMQTIKV